MKGELLKRLFRAIASEDKTAIQSMLSIVVEEERKKGHSFLAGQLENIAHKTNHQSPRFPSEKPALLPDLSRGVIPSVSSRDTISKTPDAHSLTLLASKQRFNHPFIVTIPRERL